MCTVRSPHVQNGGAISNQGTMAIRTCVFQRNEAHWVRLLSPPRDEKPKQPATVPHWRAVAERVHHVLRGAQDAGAISNMGLMKVDDCVFEQNEAGNVRLRCPLCVCCVTAVAANAHEVATVSLAAVA